MIFPSLSSKLSLYSLYLIPLHKSRKTVMKFPRASITPFTCRINAPRQHVHPSPRRYGSIILKRFIPKKFEPPAFGLICPILPAIRRKAVKRGRQNRKQLRIAGLLLQVNAGQLL